jgi:peptidoglycan/LPS O-acetylase OafA/YrhL
MERPQRSLALDVLRAVAVLLVLGRHLPRPAGGPDWVRGAFDVWFRGGWVGVDLFFVLSGYLVAGLLFQEYRRHGRLSPGRFLVRRGFKIYPAFYVFLIATLLVAKATRLPRFGRPAVLAEVFFVQNYVPGVWNHTWSLAVEEHFYLLLPLLLVVLLARARHTADPFRPVMMVFVAVAAGLLGLRIATALAYDYHHYRHLFPTHLRIDSLLAGVVLAYVTHFHRALLDRFVRPRRVALIAGGLALLAPAFVFAVEETPAIYTVGLTLFAAGSACLIAGLMATGVPANPVVRAVAGVGAHSYSIYLWHMPVLVWGVPRLGDVSYPLMALVYVAASVAVGVGMARLVELPALRLRDRWFPSRAGGAAGPAGPTLVRVAVPGEPARPEAVSSH